MVVALGPVKVMGAGVVVRLSVKEVSIVLVCIVYCTCIALKPTFAKCFETVENWY